MAAPRRARTRVAREERRDDVPYGEFGVLAYDDLADRIQCHACGRWFEKLTSFHLKRHGLTIANYKERYGLNATTALETPRITALRRRQNAETQAHHRLIPAAKGSQPPGGAAGYLRRAEYRRKHETPDALQARGQRLRRWTDEEMLEELRALQRANGGVLTRAALGKALPAPQKGQKGIRPSASAVVARFGSWRRVCELLGQPYRTPRTAPAPGAARQWTDRAILAALRELQAEMGRPLTARYLYQLRTGRKGKAGRVPSYKTVLDRFSSWQHVQELLEPDGSL